MNSIDINISEELAFNDKKIQEIVQISVEEVLKDKSYEEDKVAQWINDICEQCMQRLCESKKPFKYVVTALIMQRNGSALHSNVTCFWDNARDGAVSFVWPKTRDALNKPMYCVVTVFATSYLNTG
eukprot:TRINITY_DN1417_c0_g1_i3.p1 TRINITY_DN1417_c0_g1~~TRINITY_DN1417_c0_g1_i3.p1  ORF type:complete len:126 (+),score=14.65 TRINITY_DN1417_c0_g1_i3:73-450(+)